MKNTAQETHFLYHSLYEYEIRGIRPVHSTCVTMWVCSVIGILALYDIGARTTGNDEDEDD